MIYRFRKWVHTGRRAVILLRGFLASLFARMPSRIAPKEESRRAHAGMVVDLFASIMCRVDGVGLEDMDTTMDILRYDFPNVEHSWLAERFQNAYRSRYPLEATLALAAAKRTEAERYSLALEILTMLHRVGGDLSNPTLFQQVTSGLGLPGAAEAIELLFSSPEAPTPPHIESICFSNRVAKGHVTLSPKNANLQFRALRCANLLIIINDSRLAPLSVREYTLHKGDVIPLSAGQSITLADTSLSYATIRSLLQAHHAGVSFVYNIIMDGDSISVTRQRALNPLVRVSFGVHVELQVLRKDLDFILDGRHLLPNELVNTTYFTPFYIRGLGPYTFADLYDTGESGHSFQLSPGQRKMVVTNLPYMNSPGALMLSPGLAPGVVFEVSYSRPTNRGSLHVLEGDTHSLQVNGFPVRGDFPLKDGDLIALSPVQFLRCRFSAGMLDEESSVISSLCVRGLTRDFVRAGRVVDNIDFTLRRGEMACILGPSGSGKSTLLSLLAGHLTPTMGTVCYNEERLTPDHIELRQHIAYIPREDILDEALTVGEHVYQASIARRPRLNRADRTRRVLAVLNFVGLGPLTRRHVGRAGERTISDGERTRLNLGLDLTGTAEVFLIDEPISGLSSGDAERVIETLEGMSAGRILLCTLHRPAQSILNRFHKVMVLNARGQMAFWGTPEEMVRYFQDAAREMGLRVSREAVAAGGADYVFEVLEAPYDRLGHRHSSPSMWQERFESHSYRRREEAPAASSSSQEEEEEQHRLGLASHHRSLLELWRLFFLWLQRTFLGRVRSRMGLYAVLLEGPVLALLIGGTLRAASDTPYTFYKALHINEYLFLSLVLAMFFGLTDSACEILRDRLLLRRESNYKPFILGYLVAKCLVLTGIAAVQCALYLLVGNAILSIHEMFWTHFGIMVLTAFVGISLSLMVSAFVRTERTALNIVPLLLVPQILLAGALVRFEEMNEFTPKLPDFIPEKIESALSGLRHRVAYQDETTHNISSKPVPLIAEFCPLRYAFEMMFVAQTSDNLWEEENSIIDARRDELKLHGSGDELRFIQRAALLLNTTAKNKKEARRILRRVRKIALSHDEEGLRRFSDELEARHTDDRYQPLEFFFSNRRLVALREGVKTARKDARRQEHRGYFLSPRQAPPLGGIDQETDAGSVSTLWRNGLFLFIMGLLPILLAGFRLRRICRGK
ncbi:MAG: ATP-binding cassette domain-containing protein [Akkermansiaceae bacterium]|nr:ATP-binding cassette domain-containing protein [Akkermansiaceae bacterium]